MGLSVKRITTSLVGKIKESAKESFPKYPNLPVPESNEQMADNDAKIFAYSVMLVLSPVIFLINLFRAQSTQQKVNSEEVKNNQ